MKLIFWLPLAMVWSLSASGSVVPCNIPGLDLNEIGEKVRAAVEAQRAVDKVPAITYAVYQDSCLITKGEVSDPSRVGDLAADTSIFRLASVSKLFTTISTLQLIEQGVLNREQSLMDLKKVPFVKYLAHTETDARLEQWSKIKIHHLMSHQSGISKDLPGALAFFNVESLANHSYPTGTEFYRGLPFVEFLFPAGQVSTGIKYSNLGMNLLARIVAAYNSEKLTYAQYVKQKILIPLGMSHTFYNVPKDERGAMVAGWGARQPDGSRTDVPKAFFVGGYDGSIGVASTATDLSQMGMQLLKLLRGDSQLLKNPEMIADFVTLKSPVSPTQAWASGPTWQVLPGDTIASPLWIGHTGTGASERSALIVSPEKNLGVAILFNVTDVPREKYAKIISDLIPTVNSKLTPIETTLIENARNFLKATPNAQPTTPELYPVTTDLEKYVGTYYADIPGQQALTISPDGYLVFYGHKLVVEDAKTGKFRFPPISGSPGILFNSEPLTFSFDASGKPTEIRVANVKKFKRIN